MEKIKVVTVSSTGANKFEGIMCPQSGIIEFHEPGSPVEYSHIASEISAGYSVFAAEETKEPEAKVIEEKAPEPEVKIVEEKKEEKIHPKPKRKK